MQKSQEEKNQPRDHMDYTPKTQNGERNSEPSWKQIASLVSIPNISPEES